MRTTTILMIVIALVAFALFFRLYKGKLDTLNNKEDFRCVLKKDKTDETNINETMRLFINSSVPLVKGGEVKVKPEHIPLIMDEIKNILSLFVSAFCRIDITQENTEPVMEKGIPVYKVKIQELVETFQGNSNNEANNNNNEANNNDNNEEDNGEAENTTKYITVVYKPFIEQIQDFCFGREDCPYFVIDFDVNISEKLVKVLKLFSLNKMEGEEETLELVEDVARAREYGDVKTGLFKVLHLARTFFFSRKYSEVDIENICKENFTSSSDIAEKLNYELSIADFDNATLIEEYYSLKGQNLLLIKNDIRKKLTESCEDNTVADYIVRNKDVIDGISKLDRNADVLKSMVNMTGDFSSDKMKSIDRMANKWSEFHNIYKSQLEDLLVDRYKLNDPDHRIKRDTQNFRINKLNRELQKIRESNNPNNKYYDKFYRNEEASLQSQLDGTVLNYSRVTEKGKYVDKYMIFANGGCLKNLGGKIGIEYDYHYHRNNPNLHFNIEVIKDKKDYLAKMNYSVVDTERNRKFKMEEIPTVLISPLGMYGKVLVLKNDRLYLDNCSGRLEERFRFREQMESPCDFPEKEV